MNYLAYRVVIKAHSGEAFFNLSFVGAIYG